MQHSRQNRDGDGFGIEIIAGPLACSQATLGLSWCLRVLGVGGFKTVPGTVLMVAGTWIVLEDLSLVQFELYRGGGQNLEQNLMSGGT